MCTLSLAESLVVHLKIGLNFGQLSRVPRVRSRTLSCHYSLNGNEIIIVSIFRDGESINASLLLNTQ